MAFYLNKREFFDGALTLYQRDLTVANNSKTHREANWYMKVKIAGKKGRAITKSTKRTIYEEAYAYAVEEYTRLTNAYRLGKALQEVTFEQHWHDWFKRQVNNGVWTDSRQSWHEGYFNRYFKVYFTDKNTGKSMLLNDIDSAYANGYWDWRVNFWQSEQGTKLQKYNRKRRDAKTRTTYNASKVPAAKTLAMEQSALNQIFFDALERGKTQQSFKLRSPKVGNTDGKRAGFTDDEYNVLVRNLRSYRDCVGKFKGVRLNEWHKLQRKQMYYFVLFLANSGLRVGEARMMRWSDVKFDVDRGDGELVAEIRVSANTKKRTSREVVTQVNGNKHLKRWYEITRYKKASEWVWYTVGDNEQQRQFTDLNRSFQSVLKKIEYNDRENGLLLDADGKRRSLYSLRHVYATMRLSNGASIYDVAMNMGTQVVQIEKHYSHVLTKHRQIEITQMKQRKRKLEETNDVEAAHINDDFVDEALERFKTGKLSKEALVAILGVKTD